MLAEEFARRAHAGQVDKAGAPYIEHPGRVAARARALAVQLGLSGRIADECEAAGWLHDTIEDTGTTPEDLRAAGFSDGTVRAVQALSRPEGTAYADFVRAIVESGHVVAVLVKLADIEDNTDPARPGTAALPRSLQARYAAARAQLRDAIRIGQGAELAAL